MLELGTFEVKTNKLLVSDPCYELDKDTFGTYVINNAKHGIWVAYVQVFSNTRVSKLIAVHEKYKNWFDLESCYIETYDNLGVDSGQMAIGDISLFSKENYDKFCELTLNGYGGIVENLACVSNTGYGDGVYSLFTRQVNGDTVYAMVDFLEDI